MSTFDFHGHAVYYARAGAGDPMVFLHNGGSSHRIWTAQMEHFARTHEVFALDALGFGRSDKPQVAYTLPLYVDMLERFVEELELDGVTLVGNCMGAATALTYAARHPERVSSVVAVNVLTQATITSGVSGPLVRLARRSSRAARLLGRLPLPGPGAKAMVANQVADVRRVDPDLVEHLRGRYRDPAQMRVLMSIAANMDSFAALDRASALGAEVPVLVIWGEQNRVLPSGAGRRLCEGLQPTRELTIPGGHLVMAESPDEVNAAIEAFVPVAALR